MAWSPRSWFGAQWFGQWFGPVAVAPGTTARPGRGVVVVVGHAPSVVATTNGPAEATPEVGALVAVGHAPTVSASGTVGGRRKRAWMKRVADLTERFILRPAPKPVAVAVERAVGRLFGHAPAVAVTQRRASTRVVVAAPVAVFNGHAPAVAVTGRTRPVGGQAATASATLEAFAPEVHVSGVQRVQEGVLGLTGHAPVVRTPRPVRVVVRDGAAYVSTAAPDVAVTTRIPWTDDDDEDELSALLLLVAALNA